MADQLLAAVADVAAGDGIDVLDPAFGRDDDDAVECLIEKLPVAALAVAQGILGAARLGDVAPGPDDARFAVELELNRGQQQVEPRSVEAPEARRLVDDAPLGADLRDDPVALLGRRADPQVDDAPAKRGFAGYGELVERCLVGLN